MNKKEMRTTKLKELAQKKIETVIARSRLLKLLATQPNTEEEITQKNLKIARARNHLLNKLWAAQTTKIIIDKNKPTKHDLIITTMFKDSMTWHGHRINQVERFFNQIESQVLPTKPEIYIITGCSKDNTLEKIIEYAKKMDNVHVMEETFSKDSPVASTGATLRFSTLKTLVNTVFNWVMNKAKNYCWIESDLILPRNNCLLKLLEGRKQGFDIIAPLVTNQKTNTFYDTWGFKYLNGSECGSHYHKKKFTERFDQLATVGSCAVINGEIIDSGINFGNDCFHGLCNNARLKGYKVCCDTQTTIHHPSNIMIAARYI